MRASRHADHLLIRDFVSSRFRRGLAELSLVETRTAGGCFPTGPTRSLTFLPVPTGMQRV